MISTDHVLYIYNIPIISDTRLSAVDNYPSPKRCEAKWDASHHQFLMEYYISFWIIWLYGSTGPNCIHESVDIILASINENLEVPFGSLHSRIIHELLANPDMTVQTLLALCACAAGLQ